MHNIKISILVSSLQKNGLHISTQVQVGPPLLIQAEHMLPMAVRVSQKKWSAWLGINYVGPPLEPRSLRDCHSLLSSNMMCLLTLHSYLKISINFRIYLNKNV